MDEELLAPNGMNIEDWDHSEHSKTGKKPKSYGFSIFTTVIVGLGMGYMTFLNCIDASVSIICGIVYGMEALLIWVLSIGTKKTESYIPLLLISAFFAVAGISTVLPNYILSSR